MEDSRRIDYMVGKEEFKTKEQLQREAEEARRMKAKQDLLDAAEAERKKREAEEQRRREADAAAALAARKEAERIEAENRRRETADKALREMDQAEQRLRVEAENKRRFKSLAAIRNEMEVLIVHQLCWQWSGFCT